MKNKYSYDNKEPQEIFQDILDGKIGRFPIRYWRQPGIEHEAAIITRYFIEHVLKWDDENIRNETNEMIFRKYHLSGMLEYVFDRSPYKAINNAYPNRYKVWELTCTPKGFWKEEKNRNEALEYLLEKTNKVKVNELTNKDFICYGLGGLMDYLIKNNCYDTLDLEQIEHSKKRGILHTKISFSVANTKSKRNMVRARLELPMELLEEVGIDRNNNEVNIRIENDEIVISAIK